MHRNATKLKTEQLSIAAHGTAVSASSCPHYVMSLALAENQSRVPHGAGWDHKH
jgi:hypothetical protein